MIEKITEGYESLKIDRVYKYMDGGIWENKYIEIFFNYEIGALDNPCPHIKDNRIPIVIVVENEAGYSTTGVCLQCIQEAIKEIKEYEAKTDSQILKENTQ